MSLFLDNGFVNMPRLFASRLPFIFVVGGRGTGKTYGALEYVRKLKLLGIGVQFEKEGIYTLALGDEMLLNTFTAIAQEESKAISQNQRFSIVKRTS